MTHSGNGTGKRTEIRESFVIHAEGVHRWSERERGIIIHAAGVRVAFASSAPEACKRQVPIYRVDPARASLWRR